MRGLSTLLDALTALFLLLTVAVVAFVVLLIANPHSPLNPLPQPTPASILVQPTDPPTFTPTFTPTPGPPTATPTATGTPTATATPTRTATPTASNTPVLASGSTSGVSGSTKVPQAAAPQFTLAAFQFTLGTIQYQPNRTSDGCKWSSIAGTITDLNGQPLKGIAVSVVGGGGTIDETHYSGQEPRFGASGFEVFLGSQPRADTYTIVLLGKTGAPISDTIPVSTKTDCQSNVTIVKFQQNH